MASKKIKGITIEVGGNTTKLESALKSVDKQVYGLNSDLKNLNQALKLDPHNTDLLSQKYDVLKRNIAETEKRLQALKTAQKQMGDYSKLTDAQKSSYNALSLEIAKSESSLRGMKAQLQETSGINLEGLKSGLQAVGSVAATVLKKVLEITAAITGALAGLVAAGVKSYAQLEQNIGGTETIFKEGAEEIKQWEKFYGKSWEQLNEEGFTSAADNLISYAEEAYKTAGVSANDFLAGVNSFGASLMQATNQNAGEAIEIANQAFIDMSDNANKMGTDMQSIQNAYQGFAKQNYTMLDNLKLGYGGTKTEMERLLKDAEKISGVKYDINNLADVYNAIHVIQENLGIAGTTAEEAEKTISGSAQSMKAAFDNFLNGSGGVQELSGTIITFFKNVTGAIQELAPDILSGVIELLQTIIPEIANILIELLPQLLDAVSNMIDTLLEMVSGDTTKLNETITTLITAVVNFLTTNLPKILDIIMTILPKMAEILPTQIPIIINALTQIILDMVNVIIEHLPEFISAAIDVMLALAEGLIDAIPLLLEAIPDIIVNLVDALTKPENILKLIGAGIKLIGALLKGIIESIPALLELAFGLPKKLAEKVEDRIKNTDWGKLGSDMVKGILDGFVNIGDYLTRKVNAVKDKITEKFKQIFDIHSPSRLMRDEIGKQLTAGIGEGIEDGIPDAIKQVNSAMVDLNNGIQASVNPIINPTANSNPLYINIDKFYNKRDQDISSLAEELEYYRKNASLATGGQ